MLLMFLIYGLTRKNGNFSAFDKGILSKPPINTIKHIISILLFLLLTSSTGIKNDNVKVEKISFRIYKKNSSIGFIDIEKTSLDQTTTFNVDSEINAKVIFNFKAIGREKSVYKEDTLIFSSVYRKINNKIKLDQSIEFINGKYLLSENQKKEALDIDIIHRNLVTLFFNEPAGIKTVYCDKQNRMLNIYKIEKGKYKVEFSNSNSNIFHYKNGKCIRIEAVGSFFKVELIPKIN